MLASVRGTILPAAIVCAALAPVLQSQTAEAHQHHMASATDTSTSRVGLGQALPDTVLLNQRGEKVRFYSDLIRGRLAVINTIYTTCTTICPLMGANFASLRRILDSREERNVALISISIDPEADTPERLRDWSRQFGDTGPGWTLLTGRKADVDRLLKTLQVFTADKAEHAPVALIGSGTGTWVRASALLSASRLASLIDARLDANPALSLRW